MIADIIDVSGLSKNEILLMTEIYTRINSEQDRLILINQLFDNFAMCTVTLMIDDAVKALHISDSLKPKFHEYYHSILTGNIENIVLGQVFDEHTIFPVDKQTVIAKVIEVQQYYSKVREQLITDTIELMDKLIETSLNNTSDALSEVFSQLRDCESFESRQELCDNIGKKYKIIDLYKRFQIIIELYDVYPFKYKQFKSVFQYAVRDPDISPIEIQRRYLISTLKRDSNYDRFSKNINDLCSNYESTMAKVEREITLEEKRIRELYGSTTDELVEYTNSIINELSQERNDLEEF